jgi:hypothetical protein
MTLMSGLVETGPETRAEPAKMHNLGEWVTRHAWRLVFGASAAFWAIVAAAIYFG